MSLFIWRKIKKKKLKKKLDIGFTKSKDSKGKINNSFKILKNKPNIIISYSRNFIRFPVKPNVRIVTFLSIQITRHHIPKR